MKNYVHARLTPEESKLLREIKKCSGETESSILRKGLRLIYQKEVHQTKSVFDLARKYAGIVHSGIGDLSYNKKHLEGFGEDRKKLK